MQNFLTSVIFQRFSYSKRRSSFSLELLSLHVHSENTSHFSCRGQMCALICPGSSTGCWACLVGHTGSISSFLQLHSRFAGALSSFVLLVMLYNSAFEGPSFLFFVQVLMLNNYLQQLEAPAAKLSPALYTETLTHWCCAAFL